MNNDNVPIIRLPKPKKLVDQNLSEGNSQLASFPERISSHVKDQEGDGLLTSERNIDEGPKPDDVESTGAGGASKQTPKVEHNDTMPCDLETKIENLTGHLSEAKWIPVVAVNIQEDGKATTAWDMASPPNNIGSHTRRGYRSVLAFVCTIPEETKGIDEWFKAEVSALWRIRNDLAVRIRRGADQHGNYTSASMSERQDIAYTFNQLESRMCALKVTLHVMTVFRLGWSEITFLPASDKTPYELPRGTFMREFYHVPESGQPPQLAFRAFLIPRKAIPGFRLTRSLQLDWTHLRNVAPFIKSVEARETRVKPLDSIDKTWILEHMTSAPTTQPAQGQSAPTQNPQVSVDTLLE